MNVKNILKLLFYNTLPLLSIFLLLGIFTYLFHILHVHVAYPFAKFLAFITLFIIIYFLYSYQKEVTQKKHPLNWLEIVILIAILSFVLIKALPAYIPNISTPPRVDIGINTQNAAKEFFINSNNPYVIPLASEISSNPNYWSFKKGPVMFFGYALSAYMPQSGLKITNVFFLLTTLFALAILSFNKINSFSYNLSSALFAITAFLLSERVWHELFIQGINDILPLLLLLISFIFVKKKWWLLAGILAGLSFSARFAPAIFFIILFIRRDFKLSFFQGVVLGGLPLLAFLLWDPIALINNNFLFHFVKKFSHTSLHHITPPNLHYIFTAIPLFAVLTTLIMNFNKKITFHTFIIHFTLLYTIIQITYQEVNGNHVIYFAAFAAFILAWHRHIPANIIFSTFKKPTS